MNRPIKFRGMSLYNGVWAYGNLKKEFDKVYITSTRSTAQTKVYHASVGQFTGMVDRNDREIYEGDIIAVGGKYHRAVVWDKTSWALVPCEYYRDSVMWESVMQHPDNNWWDITLSRIEVAGNVYDNPELINNRR